MLGFYDVVLGFDDVVLGFYDVVLGFDDVVLGFDDVMRSRHDVMFRFADVVLCFDVVRPEMDVTQETQRGISHNNEFTRFEDKAGARDSARVLTGPLPGGSGCPLSLERCTRL